MNADNIVKQANLEKRKLQLTYPNLYVAKYLHINTRGQRMSFVHLPFLVEIYKALSKCRKVSVMKSVQNGISEAFIIASLVEADKGLAIQYVLPKGDIRNRFVQNRINRAIRAVPYYRQRLRDTSARADSVVLKKFGNGVINYIDSNSESNFIEFPGDALYVDEVDQCDQRNIAMAPDRLSSSPYRLERYVGNPSVEKYGIHNCYIEGSKGEWFCRCKACREWQPFDFFTNVVKQIGDKNFEAIDKKYHPDNGNEVQIYCRKCHKAMDRYAGQEWVHARPIRKERSFQINKVYSPFCTIKELVDRFFKVLFNETELQLFINSDLGLPYTVSGSKVTDTMLDGSRVSGYSMPHKTASGIIYAGIDVGSMLHLVIRKYEETKEGAVRLALYLGEVQGEKQLLDLLERYNVKIGVVDAQPELRLVERLQASHKGIYGLRFGNVRVPTINKKDRQITYHRTSLIDRTIEAFLTEEYKNPANLKDIKDYYKHMKSNTRIMDTDRKEFVWKQSSDPDHFHLAESYAAAACDLAMGSNAMSFYVEHSTSEVQKNVNGQKTKAHTSKAAFLNQLAGKYYKGG